MKVYPIILNDPMLDPLNRLILQRLLCMEPMAACKFRRMPIENIEREKHLCLILRQTCLEQGLTKQKTAAIINILKEIFTLSKIIQHALFEQWENEMKSYPLSCSLDVLRIGLDELTNRLGHTLIELSHDTITHSFDVLYPLLEQHYPCIEPKQWLESFQNIERFLMILARP